MTAVEGCDILLHEVYSEKGLANRTADWQRYHSAYHTSARDLLPMEELQDEVIASPAQLQQRDRLRKRSRRHR